MTDWRVWLWAAMHSPAFRFCRVIAPIKLYFQKEYDGWSFVINVRPLSLYVPYEARDAYWRKHKSLDPISPFDDIPF